MPAEVSARAGCGTESRGEFAGAAQERRSEADDQVVEGDHGPVDGEVDRRRHFAGPAPTDKADYLAAFPWLGYQGRWGERQPGFSARNLALMDQARVSLLRWLRRQLRVPGAMREHLEAAVENDDPAEARRVLARAEFSDAQRRYVEDVLSAWERRKAEATSQR